MGSYNNGDLRLGSGRSGSSRRGKKSSYEKPRQPQRGLGVAQLEKIRLQNQMMAGYLPSLHSPYQPSFTKEDVRTQTYSSSAQNSSASSSLFELHPSITMSFGDTESTNMRYGQLNPGAATRSISNGNSVVLLPHQFVPPAATLPLLAQGIEGSVPHKSRRDRSYSIGSISQNSDLSDSHKLDLELRL